MRKVVLLLTALFLTNSLNAITANDKIALLHMVTEDLSSIDIINTYCEQAILYFYSVVAKKGEQNAKIVKKYKECMAQKPNYEVVEYSINFRAYMQSINPFLYQCNNALYKSSSNKCFLSTVPL